MIREVAFRNWKSFEKARLYVDPLTVLIGTNASGKSNALDGLLFLNRTSTGHELQTALAGNTVLPPLRGGHEWAVRKSEETFELSVSFDGEDDRTEYLYAIEVSTQPRVQLVSESLRRRRYRPRTKSHPYEITLFGTDTVNPDAPSMPARLYNAKRGIKRDFHRSLSILSQLQNQTPLRREISTGVQTAAQALNRVFMLDPIPSNMRDYSPFSDELRADASNLAGVIAALPDHKRDEFEKIMTEYGRRLPERDVLRIYTQPVGLFASDAMLYAEEQWIEDAPPTTVDARGMSDGTLRFLAILAALLTRPPGSLVLIEEVDNGLHPSRSDLLLKMLSDIGRERNVDVLVTTHNPALLNALGTTMLPFIVAAHRRRDTGATELVLVEDITELPKLLASGPLGQLSASGKLENVLSSESS